jgi:hypothetical protein
MPNRPPDLYVWDTCCILGLFNNEQDKIAGLLSEIAQCEAGRAYLGVPTAAMGEVVRLADGQPADKALEAFLDQHYVQQLNNTREIGLLTSQLRFRFDLRNQPEKLQLAVAFGCPTDQKQLKAKDAEIIATTIVYNAARLTTYDPFLRFIGQEFITPEFGVIVDVPSSSFLPFTT